MLLFGKDTFSLPSFSPGGPIHLGGATLLPQSLWVGVITLLTVLAMKFFFERTLSGRPCSRAPATGKRRR